MTQPLPLDKPDAERLFTMLQQLKHDVARMEALLAPFRPALQPPVEEDIFAEMAECTAHAPNADDSREAIYTRMPGE